MRLVYVALVVGLVAQAASAQGPFPLSVQLTYRRDAGHVDIAGSALPGTVVQVKGRTAVVNGSGTFALEAPFPIALTAVRDGRIRRLRLDLPESAQRWLSRLSIEADLTRMRAQVEGALTLNRHPPATAVLRHVQAETTHRAPVTRGVFKFDLPLVPETNTLEWAVQVGFLRIPGPPLSFYVE